MIREVNLGLQGVLELVEFMGVPELVSVLELRNSWVSQIESPNLWVSQILLAEEGFLVGRVVVQRNLNSGHPLIR